MVSVDFERGIWSAISAVIPTAKISGCQFHWNRALDTNIASKKLGQLQKKSPRFNHFVRLVKTLLFVPLHKVHAGFRVAIEYLDKHAEEIVTHEPEAVAKLPVLVTYLTK